MKLRATCECGPYKGYSGRAKWDGRAHLFQGRVIGTHDVITFEGRTLPEVEEAFHGSVDCYLKTCRDRSKNPAKVYSGNFIVRVSPDLHRSLALMAQRSNKSLNRFVADHLKALVRKSHFRRRVSKNGGGE